MKKISILSILFLVVFLWCFPGSAAQAYTIEDLNAANTGNIAVGPGKTELLLAPGDSYILNISATNMSGMTKIVKFTTEDMGASNDPSTPIQFLGDQKGPYSLKDFVKPEVEQITLLSGSRVTMPVTISIPMGVAPGGLYGAIMVAAENLPGVSSVVDNGQAVSQVNLITRVGVLLFIRIKGDVLESSYLKDFTADKNLYEKGPVSFKITSENTGSVYLSPYGSIEVKDMFGRTVDQRDIDPWFVLPKSDRSRAISWNSNFLFGKYVAVLSLHRGYMNATDVADTKTVNFWVIPWKIVTVGLIVLILVIWLLVWILSHIQWKNGQQPKNPVRYDSNFPQDSEVPPGAIGNTNEHQNSN